MSDMTLCVAKACPVLHRCRRHIRCPDGFPAAPRWQPAAEFDPEQGEDCYGFIASHVWQEYKKRAGKS